ncbi:MAG TPA: glycosyltransferase [Acidimicrobiales bacterium]|nr:glycosyltransferase [Acidimicrobiales bacterium]
MSVSRLLFASVHGYVDPSSGAATATRDLLGLLAARGTDGRVLSTGVLDYHREAGLDAILDELGVPVRSPDAALSSGGAVAVRDLELDGVRVTLLPTASSRVERSPNRREASVFLDLASQALDRFRPQVLLTYGGHGANLALMGLARRKGVPVVFHLHNFAYTDRSAFSDASAVLVPTEFCRRHYAEVLGLDCTAIPYPFDPERVVVTGGREPRYVLFVNPIPAKGLAVFARIALELGRRRPDIPLLVVEGRGTAANLAAAGLDLSGVRNLHRMASTPDPRDFYRVARVVLMPSLWLENGAMVAREAMANGIPVLASNRGGLPETLGDSGFTFPVPARCTPESGAVPTAEEVSPWIEVIERLWDDPAWEATQRARALAASKRWDPDRLAGEYGRFFARVAEGIPTQ